MKHAGEYIEFYFFQNNREPNLEEYQSIADESGYFIYACVWTFFESMRETWFKMYDHGNGD